MLVDAIAREKNVDREVVFGAVEAALAQATKKLHGGEVDIRVVDRPRHRRLRDLPPLARRARRGRACSCPTQEILLFEAQEQIPDIEVDDYIEEPIESVPIGRIGAQAAKQVILQKIRDAEREQLLNDFLSRGDKIFVGTVKRLDKGDIIVESRPRRRAPAPQRDDPEGKPAHRRPRARLSSRRSTRRCAAPQIILSRSAPEFMIELFAPGSARDRAGPARDQELRPRPGLARQDRRAVARQARRPDRHLRRRARLARQRRHQRARRRARRHRAVVRGPGAVRDRRAGAGQRAVDRRRRGEARDGRRRRRGEPRDRDRPRRPERAPRLRADRLADQHHDGRGIGVRSRPRNPTRCASCSSTSSTSTRKSPTS